MRKSIGRAAVVAATAVALLGGTSVAVYGLRAPTAVVDPSNGPILHCAEDHSDPGCLPRVQHPAHVWAHYYIAVP